VRVANFRSLHNVEVPLERTTVLVGMNNAGKTSFLRALHLALGQDRRSLSPDDFYSPDSRQNTEDEICIDFRIVPINGEGTRQSEFDQIWYDSDFGGDLVSTDSKDREFIAVRTRITFDAVKNDFVLKRLLLADWPKFEDWQKSPEKGRAPRRFEQIISFFMDAQRDLVTDLKDRSSYIGKLLSKIDISKEDIVALETQLQSLNEDIVTKSDVLSHMREALGGLGKTVPSFGEGVEVTPVSKKVRDITKGLGVQFKDSSESSFPLDAHGMGTRSWASLLTYQAYVSWLARQAVDTHLPFHPILSLEEPEAHLHPNAQRSVYEQLANTPGQKIISTHSPYVAGHADLSAIRHFRKAGAATQIKSLPVDLAPEDVRKIRREVMHTRGELLFARAVVLFEGETEEQALPIFARHHWDQYPFERGVAFVGVGGDGNYLPFIRTLKAMGIPWLIFSDGEPSAQKCVAVALSGIRSAPEDCDIVTLPNDASIEKYLIDEGYRERLQTAIIEFFRPFHSPEHEEAKSNEIRGWSDTKILQFMEGHKTALSPYWARAISELDGDRSIPTAICDLLNRIDSAIT
jgi:putative ATP-dependent endonuclease of OLD family